MKTYLVVIGVAGERSIGYLRMLEPHELRFCYGLVT